MSPRINGHKKGFGGTHALFTEPISAVPPPQRVHEQDSAHAGKEQAKEETKAKFYSPTARKVSESTSALTDRELALAALAKATGELPVELSHFAVIMEHSGVRGPHWATNTPSLLRSVQRVQAREGERLSAWMKWFGSTSIAAIMLAPLTSLGIEMLYPGLFKTWTQSQLVQRVFNPMSLVVAFSLGLLVQKLGSYGWRRFLRLLWVHASLNRSVKAWRETDPSYGDSGMSTRAQSSQSSRRDSGTFTP